MNERTPTIAIRIELTQLLLTVIVETLCINNAENTQAIKEREHPPYNPIENRKTYHQNEIFLIKYLKT